MNFIYDPSLVLYLPLYQLDGAALMSKDKHGHLGTVTGALWRPNGHYFDGTDDKIVCGTNAALGITTEDFTLLAWVNLADYSANHRTIIGGDSLDAVHWQVRQTSGAIVLAKPSAALAPAANTTMPTNTWVMLGVVFNSQLASNNLEYFFNGISDGIVSFNHNFSGKVNAIGVGNNGSSWPWSNLIGEAWIYKRRLNRLEIQHNYLATKWRYR